MQAHKFIDGLLGNPGTKWAHPRTLTDTGCAELARDIQMAEKFDFQTIPLEPEDWSAGRYKIPSLTKEEKEFWMTGLIPLPAPVCWYEFVLAGHRVGMLLKEAGDEWFVRRFDLVDGAMSHDGQEIRVAPVDGDIMIEGDRAMSESMQHSNGSFAVFSIYLTLMLSSRTTEKGVALPPAALNKKRVKQGKEPLHIYRTVNIVPRKFYGSGEKGTGGHRRLHWRRSHLRHYDHQTPGAKYAPTALHNDTYGWWIVAIPRMLVGKEEVGTVTHDYKVSM